MPTSAGKTYVARRLADGKMRAGATGPPDSGRHNDHENRVMRAIAFDLDNTLTDRPPAFEQWALGFVEDMGIEDPDAIELLTALDNDGFGDKPAMFRAARERWNIAMAVEDLVAHFYEQMIVKNVLAPGAIDALRAVRAAGLATLIVTNGMPSQQAKIDKLGLTDLVQGIAISSLVGARKPEPAIFQAAAHQAGMSLDDIGWMIGDSAEADVRGALAIGARSGWVSRGRQWPLPEPGPTVQAPDVAAVTSAALARS